MLSNNTSAATLAPVPIIQVLRHTHNRHVTRYSSLAQYYSKQFC